MNALIAECIRRGLTRKQTVAVLLYYSEMTANRYANPPTPSAPVTARNEHVETLYGPLPGTLGRTPVAPFDPDLPVYRQPIHQRVLAAA